MKLNSDLGESFGPWKMGMDELVMPQIDMANIACGGHAGDPLTMVKTLTLAEKHACTVGAHPGYPDKLGFGRKSIPYDGAELEAHIVYQVSALIGLAQAKQLSVEYVKPHGALYNDMMKSDSIRHTVYKAMQALKALNPALRLMLLATKNNQTFQQEADQYDVELIFEAFADRRYDDQGFLVARSKVGSVLSHQDMLQQIEHLKAGYVVTESGQQLALDAQTLCVHGDNPEAIEHIKEIRAVLEK